MLVEIGLKDNTKGVYPSNIEVKMNPVKECEVDDGKYLKILSMPDFSTFVLVDDTNGNLYKAESEKITISEVDLESTDLYNGRLTGYLKAMIEDVVIKLFFIYTEDGFIVNPIDFLEDINYELIAALYAYVICKNRCYCDIDSINKLESNQDIINIYNTLLSGESYKYQIW